MGRIFSFLSNAVVVALLIGVALPGSHRFVWPEAYGLVEIAPHVWTDVPERAGAYLDLVEAARGRVDAFFGDVAPRGVVCGRGGDGRPQILR